MAKVNTFECDLPGCKALKKEANHWWVVDADDSTFMAYPMTPDVALNPHSKTYCGQEHAQKAFEDWMQTAKGAK